MFVVCVVVISVLCMFSVVKIHNNDLLCVQLAMVVLLLTENTLLLTADDILWLLFVSCVSCVLCVNVCACTQDKIEEIAPQLQYSVVPMEYQKQQRYGENHGSANDRGVCWRCCWRAV